jgi:hypothetical protein
MAALMVALMLFSCTGCTGGVVVGGGSVVQEVRANVINAVSDSIVRGRDVIEGWGVVGMVMDF